MPCGNLFRSPLRLALGTFHLKPCAKFTKLSGSFVETLESSGVLAAPAQTLAVLEDSHSSLVGRVHRTKSLFGLLEQSLAARGVATTRSEGGHVSLQKCIKVRIGKLLKLFLRYLRPVFSGHPLIAAAIAFGHQDRGLARQSFVLYLARDVAGAARACKGQVCVA